MCLSLGKANWHWVWCNSRITGKALAMSRQLCLPLGTPIIPVKLPIVKTGAIPTWRLTWQLGDRQMVFSSRGAWKIWWLMAQRRNSFQNARFPPFPQLAQHMILGDF